MDRRLIMIMTSSVNAALMTLIALLVTTGIAEIWHLMVIAAFQGFFSGLDERWALTISAGILAVIMASTFATQRELRTLRGDQLTTLEEPNA